VTKVNPIKAVKTMRLTYFQLPVIVAIERGYNGLQWRCVISTVADKNREGINGSF
jgi:hypothetical protein